MGTWKKLGSGWLLVALMGLGGATSATAGVPVGSKLLVSSVLEAVRTSILTCEVVNKSGGVLDDILITIRGQDGLVMAGPFECDGVLDGETCELVYPLGYPQYIEAAYCHAEVPEGAFVRGAFRLLQNNPRLTVAESDLEADLHGKLETLAEELGDALEKLAGSQLTDDGQGPQPYALQGAPFNLVDNGNGTVSDLNTKLMWAQKTGVVGSLVANSCSTAPHDVNSACRWSEATTTYLDVLNNRCEDDISEDCTTNGDADCTTGVCGFAGYRDWKIPDPKQLQSIVDYSLANPAIPPIFGPTQFSAASGSYWTSASDVSSGSSRWNVKFDKGSVRTGGQSSQFFVRAVRATH